MNNFVWCRDCGTHHWGSGCYPLWLVWREDGEDVLDAREIRGLDAEQAVERWAERDDAESADYQIVSGAEVTVMVIEKVHSEAGGEATAYVVTGETVPSYTASKK